MMMSMFKRLVQIMQSYMCRRNRARDQVLTCDQLTIEFEKRAEEAAIRARGNG